MKDLVDTTRLETILGPLSAFDDQVLAFATEEVALYSTEISAEDLAKKRQVILTRAYARARASTSERPRASWRKDLSNRDVTIEAYRMPYSDFFAVGEVHLSHKTHEGGQSSVMKRACFLTSDAVTVLPYDPHLDRVLLVEQIRTGPLLRSDPHPWLLEPIAGRIDPGMTPEETAHKEAMEEARITLKKMHKVSENYPSGGAIDEYLYSYVGITDLPDDITGVAGLEDEHEDIASILVSFDALMDMCDAHQLDNGPLFMSALWLARHRERLRREAGY